MTARTTDTATRRPYFVFLDHAALLVRPQLKWRRRRRACRGCHGPSLLTNAQTSVNDQLSRPPNWDQSDQRRIKIGSTCWCFLGRRYERDVKEVALLAVRWKQIVAPAIKLQKKPECDVAGGRCKEWTGTGNWKREDIFLSTHAVVKAEALTYLGEEASSAAHIQYLESSQRFARLTLHVHVQQIIPEKKSAKLKWAKMSSCCSVPGLRHNSGCAVCQYQ